VNVGYPVPGKTTTTVDTETIDLDNAPLNGGFLLKTLVLSIDPYLRGKMRDPKIKSYSVSSSPMYSLVLLINTTFSLASLSASRTCIDNYSRGYLAHRLMDRIYNFGVGVVLRSENNAVKVGQHLYGIYSMFLFQPFSLTWF
jgi:hypothetical protein